LSSAAAHAQSFTPLGDLAGGDFDSGAWGVSADAEVVVGDAQPGSTANDREAFRWTSAGGMVGLGKVAGLPLESDALAASADGSVIVGYSAPYAFRWTTAGGMSIVPMHVGAGGGSASDVSHDGLVVVGTTVDNGGALHGYRWTVGTPVAQDLGFLGTGVQYTEGHGVSGDGAVVVGTSLNDSFVPEAFRWTSGGIVGIGDLPGSVVGDGSSAAAASADGSVIVGYGTSASGREAFRWTTGGMVGLGDLAGGAFDSEATAVSSDGSIVVGVGTTASGAEAFIWDEANGMRRLETVLVSAGLDVADWTLHRASDVAVAAGQITIVGSGQNPSNAREAWRARLPSAAAVPGPGAGALWSAGLLLAATGALALAQRTKQGGSGPRPSARGRERRSAPASLRMSLRPWI
jgi:probable HAF family extracellular repeat protein